MTANTHMMTCGCPGCMAQPQADHTVVKAARSGAQPLHDTAESSGAPAYAAAGLNSGAQFTVSTITYTFDARAGHFGDSAGGAKGFALFNTTQQAAMVAAMQEYANVANVMFTQVHTTNPAGANIVFRQADLPGDLAGWGYNPINDGADITIDHAYSGGALAKGQFGFRMFMHEVGHAMGMKHPFEGASTLPVNEDSANASIMSYNGSDAAAPAGGWAGGNTASRFGPNAPQTLQIYDIAAIQQVYGVNHNYHSGNDTYTINGGEAKVFTIWDGAGADAINAASYRNAATIDLREGLADVSHIGKTSFWVAFGANIENASGGSGNDAITGNALNNQLSGNNGNDNIVGGDGNDTMSGNAGNDTLNGGAGGDALLGGQGNDALIGGEGNDFISGDAGNDALTGGAGNDAFYFYAPRAGFDTITDFHHDEDSIGLKGWNVNAANIMNAVQFFSDHARIALDSTSTITLLGVVAGGLDAGDFLFS